MAGLLLLCLLTVSQTAASRPRADIAPEDRRMLERLCLGRARRIAFESISNLKIRDDLTLAAWYAPNPTRERALRAWIRSRLKFGGARIYSDGACDVQLTVLPEEISQFLSSWLKDNPPAAGEPDAAEIVRAAAKWPRIWAAGQADLSEREHTKRPEGWEDVGVEGIQATRLAAAADAARALLDEAARLRVSASRRLDGFLNASDAIRTAALERIKATAKVQVETAEDGVAEARATLPIPDLLRIMLEIQAQQPPVDGYTPSDLRGMVLLAEREEISASGLAAPAASMIQRPRFTLIEYDAQTWSQQTLHATGHYEAEDGESLTDVARAELARIDGMDKMRQQVEALVLPGNYKLSEFLSYRPDLKDDVVIFLTGTRPTGKLRAE